MPKADPLRRLVPLTALRNPAPWQWTPQPKRLWAGYQASGRVWAEVNRLDLLRFYDLCGSVEAAIEKALDGAH